MPHCLIEEDGAVIGVFANAQKFATVVLAGDDARVMLAMAYPHGLALAIKMECQRRIYAVVDQVAQVNLAAAAAGGVLTTEQMTVYRSGLAWIASMRAKCGELIASADQTFVEDRYWPAPSSEIVALAKAF